jgi:hypothetical protein
MTALSLLTEDVLSEAVALQLLSEVGIPAQNVQLLGRNGFGYLRSKVANWKELARRRYVLLLTDLDQLACPVAMRRDWLGADPIPPQLWMRIAVREVESWLLADHDAMRQLMGRAGKLPAAPDELPDPKAHLLRLAQQAPRRVRQELVKEKDAMASQGIGYNTVLCEWVRTTWCAQRAAERSPSLRRTRLRLQDLRQALS